MNFEEALLIQREAKRVSKSVSEVETVDLGEVAKVVHAQDEDDGGQGSRAAPTSLPQTLSQVGQLGHRVRENGEPQTVQPCPARPTNSTRQSPKKPQPNPNPPKT